MVITVQKNTPDQVEEDPIRTMQKDIAMLQRGEYKPRRFVIPKPQPQKAPLNVWALKDEEQRPLERLEQFEFKRPQEKEAQKESPPAWPESLRRGEGPPTLAEISAQLIKKQAQTPEKATPPPAVLPGTAIEPEEQKRTISFGELKNVPEIDILNIENFDSYSAQEQPHIIPHAKPLIINSFTESPKHFDSPPEKIVTLDEITQNKDSKQDKKSSIGEHDILNFDQENLGTFAEMSTALKHDSEQKEPANENVVSAPKSSGLKFILSHKKLLAVIVTTFITIPLLVSGYIVLNFLNNKEVSRPTSTPPPASPTPQAPPAPQAHDIPVSVIPISSDVTLTAESQIEAASQLINSLPSILAADKFTRILIKIQNDNEIRYLNLKEMLMIFNLRLPEYLENNFDFQNATLFAYSQNGMGRLGFAVRIKNRAETTSAASLWETAAYQDTKILLSYLGPTQPNPEMKFLDNNNYSIPIRYLNLPLADLTIDYAVSDTLFIFTTSRESMFATLEAIGR